MAEKVQGKEVKESLADPEEEVKGNWAKVVSLCSLTRRSTCQRFLL